MAKELSLADKAAKAMQDRCIAQAAEIKELQKQLASAAKHFAELQSDMQSKMQKQKNGNAQTAKSLSSAMADKAALQRDLHALRQWITDQGLTVPEWALPPKEPRRNVCKSL